MKKNTSSRLAKYFCTGLLLLLCSHFSAYAVTAGFTASATSGCAPLLIQFTNTSSGAVSYSWNLGNGNTSTLKDPGANYSAAGVYTVTLTAKDASGNTDTTSLKITVFANPVADFKVNVTKGCAPLSVNFTDMSKKGSGNITSWLWDFGDGATSTSQNPKHTYTLTGLFDIILIVTDANGCKNTLTRKKFIIIPTKPSVSFKASDSVSCTAPLTAKFSATASSAIGGPLTYVWDFGDGNVSTQKNPQNTYSNIGVYTVRLTVTDTANCSNTFTKTSYIRIGKETAKFGYSPSTGCPGAVINFTNLTSPGNPATNYLWTFGDGNTSTDMSPSNNYANSGTYKITLKATSPAGCVDTLSKFVTILKAPVASFKVSDSLSCQKQFFVQFTNTTPGSTVVGWDFGDTLSDTNTSVLANPSHTYRDTGVYTVKLTVRGANGCVSTIIRKDLIKMAVPEAFFSVDKDKGCGPLTVKIKNESKSVLPIKYYEWYFGDGESKLGKDPGSHEYKDEGRYRLKLVITTTTGCIDSFVKIIRVGKKPKADFKADRFEGCISDMRVRFTSLTNNYPVKADSFFWEFGDGSTSDKENPVHHYDVKKGVYTVKLTVSNKGCIDTISKVNYIKIYPPWAKFSFVQSKCTPDSIVFKDESADADVVTYYFGDGTSTTQRNPTHIYKPGSYTVIQTAYNDSTKCLDSFFTDISVDPLQISFTGTDTTGCYPLTVKFASFVNKKATWEWDFGDGNKSSEPDPVYTYYNKGRYNVTLKVTSLEDSCTKVYKRPKMINAYGPEVNFMLDNISGCTPLKVKLTDSTKSDFPIVKKTWDLGDGNTMPVTSQVMYYTYTTPPQNQENGYAITLSVRDSAGCEQSLSKVVYPTHPRPDFYTNIDPVCGSVTYRFIPETEPFNGVGPFKFSWYLGEGDSSKSQNPLKTFYKTGTYKIRLRVTDKNGCVDSIVKNINIVIKYPTAKASATPSKIDCPPELVEFKDETILGFTGIKKWHWDFGDGSSSDNQNPKKVYLRPGKFTVTLIIEDSVGCIDTFISPDMVVVKGPLGTLTMDKKEGCTPVTVKFKVFSTNAQFYSWDMGDGTVYVGSTNSEQTHTYTDAKIYIPSVTLMDSFGCSYALPPLDTIVINPHPVTDFDVAGFCFGYPVTFTDLSTPIKGTLNKWQWDFGDGNTSTAQNPQHIYTKPGYYDVSLNAYNSHGCSTILKKRIRLWGLDAKFKASQVTGCIGSPLLFKDETFADTTIISWEWTFGDSSVSTAQSPSHTYLKKGIYKVKLRTVDAVGCSDTFLLEKLIIGDTTPPAPPVIYRVTVENDNVVQLDFEKYNDIDFHKYIIYRKDASGAFVVIDSIKDMNQGTYMDSSVNALHNVYCYKVRIQNICGFSSKLIDNEHCTVELTATPAVNAAVLNWNHYYGWKKVNRYDIYREDVYNKGSYYRVGVVNGDINTFTDTSIICYRTHTYKIQAVEDSGYSQVSWSDTSTTTPIYVPNVPPTYVVCATVEDNKEIKVEWNDLPTIKVKYFNIERSVDGVIYTPLGAPLDRSNLSIIDKKVKVHERPYIYRLQLIDSCGDASPYSNVGKTILLKVDTTVDLRPQLRWSTYRGWPNGVRYYDIELKDKSGVFNKIGQTNSGNDSTFIDKVTNLNSLPDYCYRVIAHEKGPDSDPDSKLNITSVSNEACTPVRSILWVPNVFSPNKDSINDEFRAVGMYIVTFEVKIFDRWGTRVYEGNDIEKGWDGKFKSYNPIMDSYKYIIKALGVDGQLHFRQGWVTIME